jgi:hypothetical protein
MEHLTQSFSYLAWLGQDSWECHPWFIASKHSLNTQVLITRIRASFMICTEELSFRHCQEERFRC